MRRTVSLLAFIAVCLRPCAAPAELRWGPDAAAAGEAELADELSTLRVALEETYGWQDDSAFTRFRRYVGQDYRTFYSRSNMGLLVLGIAGAQVMMGTGGDQGISNWYQDHADGHDADNAAEIIKQAGSAEFALPAYLLLGALAPVTDDIPVLGVTCDWGGNCLRTALVGEWPVLLLQQLLGSSRPRDGDRRRVTWRPFEDNNGVSGHAFLGAIPSLNAAAMTENRALRSFFGLLSVAPAWAQLQHDAHTLSQVSLGWWIAYLSTRSVHTSNAHPVLGHLSPFIRDDTLGLAFHTSF